MGLELTRFLNEIMSKRLKFDEIAMDLAQRILPIAQRIAQRLEREEAAARGEKIAVEAREKAAAERRGVKLSTDEEIMVIALESAAELEKPAGGLDQHGLKNAFDNIQSAFLRLPADNRVRAEIMKNALGQLGETGEKLRKAGKTDEGIFTEWLKQVFIPLYRRTKK